MEFLKTSATFNKDRTQRYTLERTWTFEKPRILWLMLNPSTADEYTLDHTIKQCVTFSSLWGYGTLEVVNLFALRSTDPSALYGRTSEEVGGDAWNDAAIVASARHAQRVIAAWGTHGKLYGRDEEMRRMLEARGHVLYCLGHTKGGHPKHPLRIAHTTKAVAL